MAAAENSNVVGDLNGEDENVVRVLVTGDVDSVFGSFVLENLSSRKNVKEVIVVLSSTGFITRGTFASKLLENGAVVDLEKCKVIAQEDEGTLSELGIPHSDYDKYASEVDAVFVIRLIKANGISEDDESTAAIKKEAENTRRLLKFVTTKKLKTLVYVNKLLPQRKGTTTSHQRSVLDETLPRGTKEDLDGYLGRGYSASQFVNESLLSLRPDVAFRVSCSGCPISPETPAQGDSYWRKATSFTDTSNSCLWERFQGFPFHCHCSREPGSVSSYPSPFLGFWNFWNCQGKNGVFCFQLM